MALLSARSLTKRFEGLVANNEIDLDVPEGSLFAVIGPNGAGDRVGPVAAEPNGSNSAQGHDAI
jgi:ABC-type uncharacterized transport system ATPase subunit